ICRYNRRWYGGRLSFKCRFVARDETIRAAAEEYGVLEKNFKTRGCALPADGGSFSVIRKGNPPSRATHGGIARIENDQRDAASGCGLASATRGNERPAAQGRRDASERAHPGICKVFGGRD